MLKIRALNEDSSSQEDNPTLASEAQEEIVLDLYNSALRALSANNRPECIEIFTQILEKNIPELEASGDLPKSMSNLKYACYCNLGKIYLHLGDVNEALNSFTKASELDSTDVTLWVKIGRLALKQDLFVRAAEAFSKGLECNESHWPCLDSLISVLYALRNTITCNCYIGKALTLDSEYVTGHVLRKQIYRDNPAAEEYYKKFNPDHVLEPPPMEIEASEAEKVLKEVEILRQKVVDLEVSLQTSTWGEIALPKALEEFDWVNLAKTVIFIHQYLTDNNLSHFTSLDMSKSMSSNNEKSEVIMEVEVQTEVQKEVEVSEEVVVERRMSQNSEKEEEEVTPSQTDNDEEQTSTMDIDPNEESDHQGGDTNGQKQKTGTGKKRKRDVLSDLQIWGWHSKRKPPKKSRDVTLEDALNRIIPETLLRNKIGKSEVKCAAGKEEPRDIFDMYAEQPPEGVDAYFGSEKETEEVRRLWTRERTKVHAVALIRDLVFGLAEMWQLRWPEALVPLYVQAFKLYRIHYDQPHPQNGSERCAEFLRSDASATQLFAELATFSAAPPEKLHPFLLGYLGHVAIFARFYWLEAYLRLKGEELRKNELALMSLETLLDQISAPPEGAPSELVLPNCFRCNRIGRGVVEKIIEHLNMVTSMEGVEGLFGAEKYREVADVLKKTFPYGGCVKIGNMGRPAQLGILLHSLWYTDLGECFVWTEECLHEALDTLDKSHVNRDIWHKILDKCLIFLREIIEKETVCVTDSLTEEKRLRLVENLVKIICNGNRAAGSAPWIVLHYLIRREESRIYARKRNSLKKRQMVPRDEEIPPSVALLFSAHEFLGPKGCCLTDDGQLLHFTLNWVVDKLDSCYAYYRDKMEIHVEQAIFCLWSYPSKKNKISRHLVDHNVTNPLPLTWEDSQLLYQFYAPEILPEFNSYKSQSISSELEQLFEKIVDLMPPGCRLDRILPEIRDFIAGRRVDCPDPIGFEGFPYKMRAIYYLIGDYYFKEKEFSRCVEHFERDLCVNPLRVDSWASLGLSYAAQLDQTLNFCEKIRTESEFFAKAKCAQVCFRKALELDPENLVLWIECGSFEYVVHSFCSRLIKYESENFSMEKFELLESEKENYLCSAENSLEHAIKIYEIQENAETDERWLQYYLLGKIAEKRRKHPSSYLKYYSKAASLLHENKAEYPSKINYNNPQHLSVEALELHYRVHACVLKYLELHEGKPISSGLGALFKKSMHATAKRYRATTFQEQFVLKPSEQDSQVIKELMDEILTKIEASEPKEDPDCTIVEPEVVGIVISDSDDEQQTGETAQKPPEASETCAPAQTTNSSDNSTSSDSSSSSSGDSSDSDDESSSSSSGEEEEEEESSGGGEANQENLSADETLLLVGECVEGLEVCVTRLAQNYKALYRLAHAFFHYKGLKDYARCKLLLLSEYKTRENSPVSGLFSERSARNFFNGIWRIPSTEIDRPGSLAAHMNRCVALVLQVLRNTHDTKTLIDVHLQLRKTPPRDKIYVKDSDRVGFANQAMDMCVQSFRGQIKGVPEMPAQQVTKLLTDLYRVYRRIQKHIPTKETVFGALLTDAYKTFIKETIPDNVNVLDLAIKFCVQYRPLEKPPLAPPLARNPTPAPVLPTPGTFTPAPPLKPPTLGRPRGRPPLPKIPGQSKQPRQKYATAGSGAPTWPNLNYEYLKQYQEQLIKQYSQNLSIAELQQLSGLFSSGQLTNPAVSQAFASQFFAQTSGFLSQSLFKAPGGGLSTEQTKVLERMRDGGGIMKDRPNLSITPVVPKTYTSSSSSSHKPTSSGYKPAHSLSSEVAKSSGYKTSNDVPKPAHTLTSEVAKSSGYKTSSEMLKLAHLLTSDVAKSSAYKSSNDVSKPAHTISSEVAKSSGYKTSSETLKLAHSLTSDVARMSSYKSKPTYTTSTITSAQDVTTSAFKYAHSVANLSNYKALSEISKSTGFPAHAYSLAGEVVKSSYKSKSGNEASKHAHHNPLINVDVAKSHRANEAPKPAHSLSSGVAKSSGYNDVPKFAHSDVAKSSGYKSSNDALKRAHSSSSADVAKSSSYKPKPAHASSLLSEVAKSAYVSTAITSAQALLPHVTTPPPPISPVKSGSPGKTLQEKLAEKKKEQMMRDKQPKPVVDQLKLPAGLSLSAAAPYRFGGEPAAIRDQKRQRAHQDSAVEIVPIKHKKTRKDEGAQALTVIKKLSGVDITPLAPSGGGKKDDDDVICID